MRRQCIGMLCWMLYYRFKMDRWFSQSMYPENRRMSSHGLRRLVMFLRRSTNMVDRWFCPICTHMRKITVFRTWRTKMTHKWFCTQMTKGYDVLRWGTDGLSDDVRKWWTVRMMFSVKWSVSRSKVAVNLTFLSQGGLPGSDETSPDDALWYTSDRKSQFSFLY